MSVKRGERFLSTEELADAAKGWQVAAREQESTDYNYVTFRQEFNPTDSEHRTKDDITYLHGVSFIKHTIPQLIHARANTGPIKILDIGGGEGFYAEQIRDTFGDSVNVHTTGLKKKTASQERDLHPNDLKWRSVQQLTNYPEYDLILDTYGEATYGPQNEKEVLDYIYSVISKINFGGVASMIVSLDTKGIQENERKKLFKSAVEELGCLIYQRGQRIQIYKPKKGESIEDSKHSFADLLNLPEFVRGKR